MIDQYLGPWHKANRRKAIESKNTLYQFKLKVTLYASGVTCL